MKEYGGYIELDSYRLPMLHEGAIALNCGRNCLAYLIKSRKIQKISVPYFMCDSVYNVCRKLDTQLSFYNIDPSFKPTDDVSLEDDEWLYVMNYYGQLSYNALLDLKQRYDRIIVDNAQAYFDMPLEHIDTIYTCRKYFGVSDGAFLYTDAQLDEELPLDESFERVHFLLGRFERSASEFYSEYTANNHLFASEPIKKMSKLTYNLLHAIDYEFVKSRRTENFRMYHKMLKEINQLKLKEIEGAFAYPLMVENGSEIRRRLLQQKVYIPVLWPNVIEQINQDSLEFKYAKDILPLPCDQRYSSDEIRFIVDLFR